MNNNIIKIINAPKGSFLGVTIQRPVKLRKGFNINAIKTSRLVVRPGVDYENMAKVIEGREDGSKPSENQGLPWGKWKQFPYLIEHNGQDYIRLSLVPGNVPKVEYTVDGKEISKESLREFALYSEFAEKESAPEVVTVKVESITEIR